MADNFLQFSEEITGLTEEEAQWFVLMSALASDRDVVLKGNDGRRHFSDEGEALTEEAKLVELLFEEEAYISCDTKREEEGKPQWGVWFYSDEGNDPEPVGRLVQAFYKKFRPGMKQVFYLTWSDTCSKLRIGEFGGGCMVVTEEKVVVKTTGDMVDAIKAELAAST